MDVRFEREKGQTPGDHLGCSALGCRAIDSCPNMGPRTATAAFGPIRGGNGRSPGRLRAWRGGAKPGASPIATDMAPYQSPREYSGNSRGRRGRAGPGAAPAAAPARAPGLGGHLLDVRA